MIDARRIGCFWMTELSRTGQGSVLTNDIDININQALV
jgi:hypothetical protein